MRRGHARRRGGPATAAATMRSALQLLLLLACLCCGVSSTTVSSSTTSPAVTPAATEAKSTKAATPTKPGTTTVGSSSTVMGTTRQASSASAVSPVATTGVGATTPKGTTQSLGTVSSATSGTTSKLTTAKPTSPPVADRSTRVTGATTEAKATIATSTTPLTTVRAGGSAPTTASGSDSSGTASVTPVKPKETSPSVATTASKTLPTTALSTTSVSGSSVAILRSDTPVKVAGTGTPGVAVTTSDPRHTSPKRTTPTIPGRTKDGTSSPTPAAVSTTSAGVPGSSLTVRTTVSVPELPGSIPTDGSHQALCPDSTKIICESTRPPEYQGIRMTMNESRTCDSLESSALKESLMNVFCKAVKPSFSQSRDACTAVMAPVAGHPQELAVLSVSVTMCSKNDELSESLAVKAGELEKLGFSNFSYSGKPLDTSTKDPFGSPLVITIICMAASLLLVALIYGCCHQRISRRKDQQRLTEELQTMENGYHDNPTLEVMETSAEMQEKKINLNGELGDSWIVPMDSLTKEDLEEEEDTHL